MLASGELKKVNRGVDYGFKPMKSPAQNKDAIDKWVDWHNKMGDKVFEK